MLKTVESVQNLFHVLDAAAAKARHGLSLRCEADRAETLARR